MITQAPLLYSLAAVYIAIAIVALYLGIVYRKEDVIAKRSILLVIIETIAFLAMGLVDLIGWGPFYWTTAATVEAADGLIELESGQDPRDVLEGEDLNTRRTTSCALDLSVYYIAGPLMLAAKFLLAVQLFKSFWSTTMKVEILRRSNTYAEVESRMNIFQLKLWRLLARLASISATPRSGSQRASSSDIVQQTSRMALKKQDEKQLQRIGRKDWTPVVFSGMLIFSAVSLTVTGFVGGVWNSDRVHCTFPEYWLPVGLQSIFACFIPFILQILRNTSDPIFLRYEIILYVIISTFFTTFYSVANFVAMPQILLYILHTGVAHMLHMIVGVIVPGVMAWKRKRERDIIMKQDGGKLSLHFFEETVMKDGRLWNEFKAEMATFFCLENALFAEEYHEWLGLSNSMTASTDNLHKSKRNVVLGEKGQGDSDSFWRFACEQLARRYIWPGSLHELNITHKNRQQIQTALKKGNYNFEMFRPVYLEVVSMMCFTYYPRFLRKRVSIPMNDMS